MIKTKYLEAVNNPADFKEIDELINGFIKDNPEIEIIDIKFQSHISAVADSGISAEYYLISALIIYKDR